MLILYMQSMTHTTYKSMNVSERAVQQCCQLLRLHSVSDGHFWNDNDRGKGLEHVAEHTHHLMLSLRMCAVKSMPPRMPSCCGHGQL
jgi:hypothetical protein